MAPWASLVGWLGLVFLIFGLLAATLQLLTGGLFWSRDQLWIWGNLGLGVAMLAIALLTNLDALRDRLRSGEARRASRYGATAILNTALGIAILALLAFLATRYNERFDWTEARTHSLSEQTLGVLERLDGNVEITALYPSASTDRVRELVDRYARAEGVRATYADPQARPDLVRALGVAPERLEGGLVVV